MFPLKITFFVIIAWLIILLIANYSDSYTSKSHVAAIKKVVTGVNEALKESFTIPHKEED